MRVATGWPVDASSSKINAGIDAAWAARRVMTMRRTPNTWCVVVRGCGRGGDREWVTGTEPIWRRSGRSCAVWDGG
eukprot:4087241-Prymnesium_polylepis.1